MKDVIIHIYIYIYKSPAKNGRASWEDPLEANFVSMFVGEASKWLHCDCDQQQQTRSLGPNHLALRVRVPGVSMANH